MTSVPPTPAEERPPLAVPAASYSESAVQRWRDGQLTEANDFLAEEMPVALIYNGTPHAVMLATPADLEDFVVGFSLTEGIVLEAAQVAIKEIRQLDQGVEVWLKIPGERFRELSGRGRGMAGRTGCGLCGISTLDDAVRRPPPVDSPLLITAAALARALAELREHQTLNSVTGAVHGAAWADGEGRLSLVREDVGRHNALDKLVGALARRGTDCSAGFIVVTSRASYEMVQKAATLGVGLMAAISAPTGLAVRLAQHCGLTLVGFARGSNHNVYTHPQRLLHY